MSARVRYPQQNDLEPIPLVIVEGFLGGAATFLWGDFDRFLNQGCNIKRRSIFASVGPVSSLHDRACELYYTLLGGTVDYGELHGKLHRHARYGRMLPEGLYPKWSRSHPLHFLGHSIGGPTIMKLQFLLKQGHFGPNSHPDMVLSVSAISAPFRGTQLVYILGECTDAAPAIRPLSIGSMIVKWVHLVTFMSPFLARFLDLHAEARSLSFRELPFTSLLKQLWQSDWAESMDATPFDVTFGTADEREANLEGHVHPKTFYRSHTACMTKKASASSDLHTPALTSIIPTPLYVTSKLIGSFDYSVLWPIPSFLEHKHTAPHPPKTADIEQGLTPDTSFQGLGEEYWANDGVVPLFSQWHPFPCSLSKCRHYGPGGTINATNLEEEVVSGIWHVHQMDEANHVSIVPFWTGNSRQKNFWEDLGRWLRRIDEQVSQPFIEKR